MDRGPDRAERARRTTVASFPSRPLAELARGFLEEHGVDALVAADDANGTQPEVGFVTGGAWLVVRQDDADHARSLLDAVAPPADPVPAVAGHTTSPARTSPWQYRLVASALVATIVATVVWGVITMLV